MDLFELDAQIACVEREIKMRQRVYPRWVGDGRMTQAKADTEMRLMQGVLETLRGVKTAGGVRRA